MFFRKTIFGCLAFVLFAFYAPDGFARCRVQDLISCLDSVCAINIGISPGARCYLCGNDSATRPEIPTSAIQRGNVPGMQELDLGRSGRNTLSERDLRNAPTRPSERFAWAQRECFQRVNNCTSDDVEDNYAELIRMSCDALGVAQDMTAAIARAQETKTAEQCTVEFNACLLADHRCGLNMLACAEDADFNRNFSACMVETSGCDDFTTAMRASMMTSRDEMLARRDGNIQKLVDLRRMERENRLEVANRMCTEGGREGCIAEVCGNMSHGLQNGVCANQYERMWAASLCRFVEIACDRVR